MSVGKVKCSDTSEVEAVRSSELIFRELIEGKERVETAHDILFNAQLL